MDSGHELDELEQDQKYEETGGGMTTSGGSGLNILGGYFPILV